MSTLAGRLDDYEPDVTGHLDVSAFPWPGGGPASTGQEADSAAAYDPDQLRDKNGRWRKADLEDILKRAPDQRLPTTHTGPAELSPAEEAAVTRYGAPYFNDRITAALRSGNLDDPAHQYEPGSLRGDVAALDGLIARNRLTAGADAYRGVALTKAMARQMRPGAEFTDLAYTSVTSSPKWAGHFARLRARGHDSWIGQKVPRSGGVQAVIRMRLTAGQHIAPVSRGTGEYLLPRGTTFRVERVSADGKQIEMTVAGGH